MTTNELFDRCKELALAEPSPTALRLMHETLVLACAEALKNSATGFGNLFAQVDYLAKRSGMSTADRMAVQQMRRRSNRSQTGSRQQWLYDVRALTLFVAAVFATAVPDGVTQLIPHSPAPMDTEALPVNSRYLRCIVNRYDALTIDAETADGQHIVVDYSEHGYLCKMLRQGMQLNLLDSHVEGATVTPRLVVVEPDFLVDISAIARCFQGSYGHHPLTYTIERLRPRGNSQAMLLGNFAGAALDDIINQDDYRLSHTLNSFFSRQALQFATCQGFNAPQFLDEARQQSENIRQAVAALFDDAYDRTKALIEPSFVCERLGLQGRVDLMTSDMRLLVEQKSGKNYSLERAAEGAATTIVYKEDHYVQLLLYYGILRYNFGRTDRQVDIRLLYSRYPAARGLLYAGFYRELFHQAISLRNQVVATEMLMARKGFGRVLPLLRPDVLFQGVERDGYFHRYVEPPVADVALRLQGMSPLERAYLERMMTFVYREQLLQKVGRQEGQGGAASDLWNMPLAEKLETGNIILSHQRPAAVNFRRGDMVYLYNYSGEEPDARQAILYKGTLERIDADGVSVALNEGMDASAIMSQGPWAIEHAGSDQNTTSAIKSLYQLMTADASRRALLLGQRAPRRDTGLTLQRSYHPDYDNVVSRACQARDYFLLVGPPGTGKTSMALRFLVDEELSARHPLSTSHPASLLLTAYTNRAVDEICAMLDDAGHDYLRIGNAASCDARYSRRLLENRLGDAPKLDDIRRRMDDVPIVVGTTSMLQARPFIFQLKHFSLCIVDEASQILEPNLVGLLSSSCIDRFILVGDHKQLPAVVQQTETESAVDDPLLKAAGIDDCRVSLFERLLRWERRCGRTDFVGTLRKQGRMHPDVAAFPNELFYSDEHLEPVPLEHQKETSLYYDRPSEDAADDVLKQQRVLFIDSSRCRFAKDQAAATADRRPTGKTSEAATDDALSSDKANIAEARITADLLRRIHRFYGRHFDAQKTVGVIVPYRNQIAMIREEIARLQLPALNEVSIDTVERYQGSQRDVIVYSFTVSRPYQLDFLTSNCFTENGRTIDRKLNVAMTRARKQLILTGNAEILQKNSIFALLIARYQKNLY